MSDAPRSRSRRDEYADLTRQDAVTAARELFAEHGYAATTVDSVARRARVSPATVYAQCGGKEGLLGSLMDLWTTGSLVQRIIDDCAAAGSGRAKLATLARGYVALYAESGDIIRIVTRAAAGTPAAAAFLATADERHREALRLIVEQIRDTGDLAPGLSIDDAVKIIFFYFRHEQFALLADEFGWGVEGARRWIAGRVETAILADGPVDASLPESGSGR